MFRSLFIFLVLTFCMSCASNNNFQGFYNNHKHEADWALAFPKYVAMIAVPREEREEIRYFSKGMKKIRVLYDEYDNSELLISFKSFAEQRAYSPYLIIKKDGSKINLFAYEENEYIREIILDVQAEDESVIIGLIGKMKKSTFQKALQKAGEE